ANGVVLEEFDDGLAITGTGGAPIPGGGSQPVLVDDIASSGRTLAEAARQLVGMGFARPDCVVVHPLFAGDAAQVLGGLVERIVSTNAVAHTSNDIDVMPAIAEAVRHGI
ncbi:hypothetical protein ACQKOH_22845, partial [Sphingomonas sp. NPDC092331]